MNTDSISLAKLTFNSVMKELKQFNIYNREREVITFQKYFILETNKQIKIDLKY